MKKSTLTLFVSAFIFIALFTSCNAGKLNDEAEKTSTAFYANLQQKNYAAALLMCSDKAFANENKEEWNYAFKKNAGLLGNIVSFKKTSSFNIATSTSGGTTVKMAFDVQWQYGKSEDSVFLIKEKDGSMKIFHYSWKHNNTKYLTAMEESEAEAVKYINAIKNNDYAAALSFCSEEALKTTPKEKWTAFLSAAANRYGVIENYKLITDSSTYNVEASGQAGKGNYYDILVKSKRGDKEVMEKVVFFQKNYAEPVRLTGHYFL